jgi:DNA-binding CsgD family transcriptional regulator/tetratricopeptide (TPR) repeat protein
MSPANADMPVETAASAPQRLMEREPALTLLKRSLLACRSGAGCTVLVAGEAGIGKTSLLRAWAEHAKNTDGADVFWGGCEALFTPRPLGAVLDIAQALSPAMASLVQEQASPSALFAALGSWLAVPGVSLAAKQAQARVNVLVFEDVHWADHLTLDFLKYLGRRIHQWPAMLILSYRDDETGASHPLTQVLGDLPPANTHKLQLQALSFDAVATLSGYPAGRAHDLLAVTGGNPFFVTEVLATTQRHHPESPNATTASASDEAAQKGVPATVSIAVLARAQRVSRQARAVLEAASLVPGAVDPAHLTALVGDTAAAGIEECTQAGLLQWTAPQPHHHLAFRHELARRAVEAGLSPLRRREMHARLYLLVRQHSHELLDRAAYHAQHAQDSMAVLASAPLAAARAASLGAHHEAAAHYRVALDHAQQASDGQHAELLENWAAELSLFSGGTEEAVAARLQAMALRRSRGETEQVGVNQRALSSLYRARGDIAQAQQWLDTAIRTLEGIAPSAGLAMAYSIRSATYMVTNQWRLAQTWGERAIEVAQPFAAHGTIAHALNNIGSALADDGQLRGYALVKQSLDLALAHHLHNHAARAYWNASETSLRNRLLETAEEWIVPGIAFAQAHDLDLHRWGLTGAMMQLRLMQGRLEEAHLLAQEALHVGPSAASHSAVHRTVVTLAATVAFLRDPRTDSSALHVHWPTALASGEPDHIVPMALALAEAAWLRDDHQACGGVVRAAFQACAELTLWDKSELALWAHRSNQALAPGSQHTTQSASQTAWVAACALERQGDLAGAARAWAELGMPRHQAYALMLMDPREHPQALAEAITLFDRMGATACVEQARRRARQWASGGIKGIKTGPRSAARQNRYGLTPRELQIAQHLAAGATNQDIAQALSRSTRTVEHHVATTLSKLGAKRRGDVAALLALAQPAD